MENLEEPHPKPIISINHAVNWYIGNFILNPNNALRNDEKLMQKAHEDLDKIKLELAGHKMTHRQFLDIIREGGLHDKYYKYQKPKPTTCRICRFYGIKF